MDTLRRLAGATAGGLLTKEEVGQDRYLLAEDGGGTSDSEEESRILTLHRHKPRWPAMFWMMSSLFLSLYSVLLTIYAMKKPSDLACAKQLSVWCKWEKDLDRMYPTLTRHCHQPQRTMRWSIKTPCSKMALVIKRNTVAPYSRAGGVWEQLWNGKCRPGRPTTR